jgi:hypothetical protein
MTHAVQKNPLILLVLLASLPTLSCVAGVAGGGPRRDAGNPAPVGPGAVVPPSGGQVLDDSGVPIEPDAEVIVLPDAKPTPAAFDLLPPVDSPPAILALHERVCGYMQKGPFAPIMGQVLFSEKAPPIKSDAQAYRVTLSGRNGYVHVTFTAPTAGEYVFFGTINMPLALFTLDGSVVNLKSLNMSIQECTQVKYRASFDLAAGGAYVVRIGPVPLVMGAVPTSVDLVVAPQ